MKDPSITWQRTFPQSEPGTDGVAVFEGRIIGRIMHMTNLPRDPKPWSWSVTDPELAGQGRFVDASAAVLSRELMRARFELPIQDVIKVVHGGRPCGAPPRRNGDPSTPQLSTKTADPPVTGSLSIAPPVRADVLPPPRHKL